MPVSLDPGHVRYGTVTGRYFRENFAQGGLDLVQILPEVVTNADAAIAASGREHGRILIQVGEPDPGFVADFRRELRGAGIRGLPTWRQELRCTDDGEGVTAEVVQRRLGSLGVTPEHSGQRGLFGRGLRDVWLAQGGGRIEGVRDGHIVEAWFFPAPGDDPYAYAVVRDEPVSAADRARLGLTGDGTRVTVPLPSTRRPANGRIRNMVAQLVQLRPVLDDPDRELWLDLPGEPLQRVHYPEPEPDAERPVLFSGVLELGGDARADVEVWRSARPLALSPVRALRRGGLVVRSGRAAHEVTLVGHETRPGARYLYGQVRCDQIEELQRRALSSSRPELVVKADRSGLNEHHPLVVRLHAALDELLKPIIEAEERRAGAHLLSAGREVRARDEVGLRELNDALRSAFDAPGAAGFARGAAPGAAPPVDAAPAAGDAEAGMPVEPPAQPVTPPPAAAMRFKQLLVRLHPGEQRGVSLLFDPAAVAPGATVAVQADPGVRLKLWSDEVPEPNSKGWARLSGTLRARATAQPGARLTVTASAGEHAAELEVAIVRHHGAGWVREIARQDEDSPIEALFDAESGVVTVFVGRPEFRALERAARRSGLPRKRVAEYVPYRMLEVEAAANAVYAWAAEEILVRRLAGEPLRDPLEYARALHLEAQTLRHRVHERLMRAFLEPEVFDGGVMVRAVPAGPPAQGSLLG